MRQILCLSMLLICSQGMACDDPANFVQPEALSEQDAERGLSKALLNRSNTVSSSLKELLCKLNRDKDLLDSLGKIVTPLDDLRAAAESAETPEEKRAAILNINKSVNRDAGTGFVVFPDANGQPLQLNLFSEVIAANCLPQATSRCGRAAELAQTLWMTAGGYRALSDALNAEDKAASLAYNERLDRKWRSYKDDTIKLWPQEVLLNSIVYQPEESGLSEPPSYKLLALRPALGLSYLSDDSHHFQPTINVDLLGVYWWQYGGESGAEAQPGRGISASLVWDGDDTAYGITYHHNPKWSATLAHGDENDVVVSISFQLAHWFIRDR